MLKQFVCKLKGVAFEWYIDLQPEFINNWGKMEQEFLNKFYNTQHTTKMTELTNTKRSKDELVLGYINISAHI